MVTFNRLTMRNFKRFSGEHHICLSGGGRVTVVAAENGLGKTTMMDAIHVALYGKRGFRYLYPQKNFNQWIVNAHSVDADQSGSIVLAIEMEDPVLGIIRLSRSYWILDATKHDIEEEVGITVAGKPLEKESGETRSGLAERWIEDYLPHAAMRRFLVDGERLSHLDPRQIDIEIVQGIDDATGIGLLHRLKRHLDSVKKQTLKTLAPEEQEKSVSHLLKLLESVIEDRKAAQLALDDCVQKVEADGLRIIEIQNDIESLTQDGGSENVQLRMDYAICQSKVTSSRQFVHEHLMESLPFVVAGLPDNLSEWMIDETLAAHRSTKRVDQHRTFLESILEESQVGKITRGRLERSSERILESMSISSSEDDVHWKGTFARPDRQRRVDLVFALSLALADSRVRKNTDWREPVLSRDGACSPGLRLYCLGVAALRGAPVQKKDPASHAQAGAKRVHHRSRSDGDCRVRFLTEPGAHLPSKGRNHAGRTTGPLAARRSREPPYARAE